MKVFQLSHLLATAIALVIATSSCVDAETEFTAITAGVNQDITQIAIGPALCVNGTTLPNTMFTVFSTDSFVSVQTYPANLITVATSSDETTLELEWNVTVASSATESGVQIGVPAGQLTSVAIFNATRVQIVEGFTHVATLHIHNASTVAARFLGVTVDQLEMSVTGASTVNVDSDVPVNLGVAEASTVNVKAPSVAMHVAGASTVGVDGDVANGTLTNASTLTIAGSLTGDVTALQASTVHVGGGSTGCDQVLLQEGANCNSGRTSVNVRASVHQSQTTTGTRTWCPHVLDDVRFFTGDIPLQYYVSSSTVAVHTHLRARSVTTCAAAAVVAGLVAFAI